MKRLLVAAVVACLALAPGRAANGQERVTYLNPATQKEDSVSGTIESEGPAGIKIKPRSGAVREIPTEAIRQVIYRFKSDTVTALDYRQPFGREARALLPGARPADRQKYLEEALKGYQQLAGRLKGETNAQRYTQFKAAEVLARLAQDDPNRLGAAITALTAYKTEHPKSWEVLPCLRLLARMQEEKGDVEAARKAYEELGSVPGAPQELKRQSGLLVARLLLRHDRYAEAEKQLQSLEASLSRDDPRRPAVEVFRAACQLGQGNTARVEAVVNAALKEADDGAVKAQAHNVLGDYYRLKNQPENAFWHYLWVDVSYPQDRDEHAKALYHLRALFDKVKRDPVRAAEFARKLAGPEFEGTFYQRQLTREKK